MKRIVAIAIVAVFGLSLQAPAAYIIDQFNVEVTENFDSWDGTGEPDNWTLFANHRSANNSTPAAFRNNDDGSLNSGGWRSYRVDHLESGSLGFLGNQNWGGGQSANDKNWARMTMALKNETGFIIESLDISYFGEQWAEQTGRASYIFFEYSLNGTDWTDVAAMTFNAIRTIGDEEEKYTARNGDDDDWRALKSVNLTGLSIANDSEFYLRWSYNGGAGSGGRQGLSIDDIQVTAIPEPLSVEMLAVSVGLLAAYRWRRRLGR